MRHGRHIPRVSLNGAGQFRTQSGGIQNASGLRVVRSVRPNAYQWKLLRDPRLSDRQRPWPFDLVGFVDLTALPGMIQTAAETLFGNIVAPLDTAQSGQFPAPVGVTSTGGVPLGLRGTIDQIAPFAQDIFGNPVPIVFPAGTTVVWSILINGRAAAGYGNITTLLDPWGRIAERPLIELAGGDRWAATVFCSANALGLAVVGLRMRIKFENQAYLNGERELHNPADLDFQQAPAGQAPALPDLPCCPPVRSHLRLVMAKKMMQ